MAEAWIIDAARTPRGVGKVGKGVLAGIHPQRLLSTLLKALADRKQLDTATVDDVVAGCGSQMGLQGNCIARMAALDAGYNTLAPGVSLDRFCGSALTAVNVAAMGVMSGSFAVVPLKFMRDLDVDPAIVNVNGGAMALGAETASSPTRTEAGALRTATGSAGSGRQGSDRA